MNKLIITVLLLACSVRAEMYFDIRAHACRTYPDSDKINQDEYNEHVSYLYWDLLELSRMGQRSDMCLWNLACVNAAKRAEGVKSPTAKRFIADLALIPTLQAFNTILGFK